MNILTTPISVVRFYGDSEGQNLLVLGAIHGNELCGMRAIEQIIEKIKLGSVKIKSGSVTFIPISNPKAYTLGQRRGDRDLNRGFGVVRAPYFFEDKLSNFLIKVMEDSDVLLDLHSFRATGEEFIFVGPENNDGNLEPFCNSERELRFAQRLGVRRMVYGWLHSYAKFVTEQHSFLEGMVPQDNAVQPSRHDLGVGTTEFFRSLGKYGVTIECGNHVDEKSVEVAHNAILNALVHLEIIESNISTINYFEESFRFSNIFIRRHVNDKLAKKWQSFDRVREGEILGFRFGGEKVLAPSNGAVIFCYEDARVGAEWIYFAEASSRGLNIVE